MTTPATVVPLGETALRAAAVDGLRHASRLIAQFGWEPATPDGPTLHILGHLRAAARSSAAYHRERADDVRALMGYLLVASLETEIFLWEDEPGRTVADVRTALTAAADKATHRNRTPAPAAG
ncbi:hypothetical protein [Streptomyces anulatus]|uniref:DUF6197 family protein n=1 Tax=Streptomyces anulatus TaxID=1892 RepID=UPI002E13DCCA|nr:hypothetical protein OG557_39050 [Streptomyces anulatus]